MTCAKQLVIAIIVKGNKHWIGTNECRNPQEECPRDLQGFETGEGYHLCRDVCQQDHHAEINALKAAGENARGATLYLIGHTYACEDCKRSCKAYGIKNIIIAPQTGESSGR